MKSKLLIGLIAISILFSLGGEIGEKVIAQQGTVYEARECSDYNDDQNNCVLLNCQYDKVSGQCTGNILEFCSDVSESSQCEQLGCISVESNGRKFRCLGPLIYPLPGSEGSAKEPLSGSEGSAKEPEDPNDDPVSSCDGLNIDECDAADGCTWEAQSWYCVPADRHLECSNYINDPVGCRNANCVYNYDILQCTVNTASAGTTSLGPITLPQLTSGIWGNFAQISGVNFNVSGTDQQLSLIHI